VFSYSDLDCVIIEVRIERIAAPADTEKTPTQSTDSIPIVPPPMVARAACEKVLIALSPEKLQNLRLQIVIVFQSISFYIFIGSNGCVCRYDNRQQRDPTCNQVVTDSGIKEKGDRSEHYHGNR
jgi:hypothetical protein